MRNGSGLDKHAHAEGEVASGEMKSQMVPRGQAAGAANDDVLSQHIAMIWRLLRAMEVSRDEAQHYCVSAFEEAFARDVPPVSEAVGGIPIERVVDPLLTAAFRAARVAWQALLQGPDSEPGSSSVRNQGELLVLGLLGSLDEAKRAILLLADMEQLSSPEIAALMGLPLDVVYDELRKARRAFVRARKRLEHIGATGDAEAEARELLALARTRFSADPAALLAVSQQLRVGR